MFWAPVPGLRKATGAAAAVATAGVRSWDMVVMAMTQPGPGHWVHPEAALVCPGPQQEQQDSIRIVRMTKISCC